MKNIRFLYWNYGRQALLNHFEYVAIEWLSYIIRFEKKMMILSVMEYSGNCINTHDYLLTMTIQ